MAGICSIEKLIFYPTFSFIFVLISESNFWDSKVLSINKEII